MFAIGVGQLLCATGEPPCFEYRVIPMRTFRRIQAASLRVAPQWFLCVFLGAYVAMQMASSNSTAI